MIFEWAGDSGERYLLLKHLGTGRKLATPAVTVAIARMPPWAVGEGYDGQGNGCTDAHSLRRRQLEAAAECDGSPMRVADGSQFNCHAHII